MVVGENMEKTLTVNYAGGMTAIEEEKTVKDAIELRRAAKTMKPGSSAHGHVANVLGRMQSDLGVGVHKKVAARTLGISVPALDKWIKRGYIGVVRTSRSRELVRKDDLLDIAVVVQELRERGERTGLVAAAVRKLELEDAGFQERLGRDLRPGLEAMAAGNLVPAVIPSDFGPDD